MDQRRESVTIDLSGIANREELHAELARALDFPDIYGRNWAAFWDAITGLVEMPRHLVLKGWSGLEEQLPEEADAMRRCLEDAASQFPGWSAQVEYA